MKSTVETRNQILDRSNRSHTFFKIGFLKISQYSQESTCVGACDFIKKNLQHRYFPVKFASKICKIFKNTDFLQNADGGFFCLEGQIP